MPEVEPDKFKRIRKSLSEEDGRYVARILPGEYYVTDKDEIITTVLGSCVSACICDPQLKIGGMNHFMLPEKDKSDSRWSNTAVNAAHRYGNFAMESLINEILSRGGNKNRLLIKVFGGSNILESMTDIGQHNINFVKSYLHSEQLDIAAQDLGNRFPRKINFYPHTGRVRVKKLSALYSPDIAQQEQVLVENLKHQEIGNDATLFQ